MKSVTAVFDIGKTNKKFFLFDEDYQEIYREYITIDTIQDETGYPAEDLTSLRQWLKEVFDKILSSEKYNISAINFSTYGASLVHLDEAGEVLTPLYNYTKPLQKEIRESFFEKYGPEAEFLFCTGAPYYGMLNSGLQLYWLKKTQPDIFKKIKYSLHLPQYISYIFTGIPISEYTSIGCHTALWDFHKKDYHSWVYEEGMDKILPPIVSTETSINMNYNGKRIRIGVGIHDSSAALIPYVRSSKKKFILVSTGTWSITLNPFSSKLLSLEEINSDCLHYMRIDGKPVKSARFFLGNEYSLQVEELSKRFDKSLDYHKQLKFNRDIYRDISNNFKPAFRWKSISSPQMPEATKITYTNFEYAYHHLMMELVQLQVHNINLARGEEEIDSLFVDGGFSDNDIYIKLLSHYLSDMELRTTNSSLGSALGAAIVISDMELNSKFLKENYSLKKHVPFILK